MIVKNKPGKKNQVQEWNDPLEERIFFQGIIHYAIINDLYCYAARACRERAFNFARIERYNARR